MASPQQPDPQFDSTREALYFAFNVQFTITTLPATAVNRAMSEVGVGNKALSNALAKIDAIEPMPGKARRTKHQAPGATLHGLDRVAQAAFILRQVEKLDRHHRNVLAARLTRSRTDCLCRRPCCQGWLVTSQWGRAVEALCELLQDTENAVKVTGKKGFSSQPDLRRAVVSRFFDTSMGANPTQLQQKLEISPGTVASHTLRVTAQLGEWETKAWLEIQDLFDQAGITGWIS